jgi:glycine/D-amino acid oxidase-like deaminating enzyme
MRVLICGGRVIGVAIAYYLSLRGAEAVVMSGPASPMRQAKSGGFLALDWCDGSRLLSAPARRSFALHAEPRVPGGYRRLTTFGGLAIGAEGGG